jgi:predicted oxidoreductase (fatty acid repression mutant protein)
MQGVFCMMSEKEHQEMWDFVERKMKNFIEDRKDRERRRYGGLLLAIIFFLIDYGVVRLVVDYYGVLSFWSQVFLGLLFAVFSVLVLVCLFWGGSDEV